jgi:hypothetical protein
VPLVIAPDGPFAAALEEATGNGHADLHPELYRPLAAEL